MRAWPLCFLLPLLVACQTSSSASTSSAAPPTADGESQAPVLPHEGPGLAVGQAALPFTLHDQHDQPRSLDQWLGQGPVAVVFFRSADW